MRGQLNLFKILLPSEFAADRLRARTSGTNTGRGMSGGRRRRRRACARVVTAAMVVVPPLGATAAHAATVHWDIDGATLGSEPDDTPYGTRAPQNAFWTADSNGLGPHAAWVSGDTANFSASSDATGAFTVTISGSQTAGGLTFQEGTVTLGGGTLNLNGAATVNVLILRSATI